MNYLEAYDKASEQYFPGSTEHCARTLQLTNDNDIPDIIDPTDGTDFFDLHPDIPKPGTRTDKDKSNTFLMKQNSLKIEVL